MSDYKLVPVEPTTSMVHAAMGAAPIQEADVYAVYDAIRAAAPDHIPDAGKMVADQLRGGTKKIGRPQIREVFLRNGARIEPDRDDLPDYVYESVFELMEMAAPAVQGERTGQDIQKAINSAPEALRELGEYLGRLLDEDRWPEAERKLEAAALAVQPVMNWRNCYHRASMDLCAIGELLGVPEEDQCTPEIIEAIKALQQPSLSAQGEPVAWMVSCMRSDFKKPLQALHLSPVLADETCRRWKSRGCNVSLQPLYTAPQPAEQKPFEWPLLDAPALIGGVVVGKGCSSGHVVMIAQRKYEYEAEHSPEEHARRKKAFQDALAQIRDGVGQQPDEAWSDDADSDSAAVAEAIRAREEAIAQVSGLQLQVAGLVETLEHVRYWIDRRVSAQGILVTYALSKIDTALSAHRKGEGI